MVLPEDTTDHILSIEAGVKPQLGPETIPDTA